MSCFAERLERGHGQHALSGAKGVNPAADSAYAPLRSGRATLDEAFQQSNDTPFLIPSYGTRTPCACKVDARG
jgi:hypothetical protein